MRAAALALALGLAGAGCGRPGFFSRGEETPAAWRELLFQNPGHPRAAEIRQKLDEADYAAAAQEHTARAYLRYLEHHPAGAHARRARHWAERISYYDALSSPNPAALKEFLQRFPESGFATEAGATLQRAEYEEVKKRDTIEAWRAFVARHKGARSEWTAAATQRLERLLLDRAKAERNELVLARYIHDNPESPYLGEARTALREAAFERVMRSRNEADWAEFIRSHPGTKEAEAVARHVEEEALRGAERSGRVSALEAYLARYPGSPHKERIQSAIALMVRERSQQAHRWVRIKNAETEVFRPLKCPQCAPVLKVNGTLENTDPDFAYDLVLEALLTEGGRPCCRTRHEERRLRPGESRPFSFPIRGPAPAGAPPAFEVRVASGSAYPDREASRRIEIPGLGTGQKEPPPDRFAPEKVPPIR